MGSLRQRGHPRSRQRPPHDPSAVASTSALPTATFPPPTETLPRGDAVPGADCWCGGTGARGLPAARPTRRRKTALVGALAAALLPVAAASSPPRRLSPVQAGKRRATFDPPPSPPPTPPPLPAATPTTSRTTADLHTPTPTPTPTLSHFIRVHRLYPRSPAPLNPADVEPLTPWTLNGRSGLGRLAERSNSAVQEYNIANSTSADGASATSTASAATSSSTKAKTDSTDSTTSSFVIPDGWAVKKRQTSFYAVPVIIAVSVILAVIVIGFIVGSVVWRRKRRTRAERRKATDPEKALGADEPHRTFGDDVARVITKGFRFAKGLPRRKGKGKGKVAEPGATSVGGSESGRSTRDGGRVRRRRARRSSAVDGPDEDGESATLTRTRSSGGGSLAPADSLTRRISTKLAARNSRASLSRSPTIVSSTPVSRTTTRSSASSSRPASIAALRDDDPPSTLGQPPDSHPSFHPNSTTLPPISPPAPSSPGSFGSMFPLDATLAGFGPPAYRPSSTIIQTTTRLTYSLLARPPSPPPPISPTSPSSLPWSPDEKPARTLSPPLEDDDAPSGSNSPPPPPPPADEDEGDGRAYRAHVATDDKALLALLHTTPSSSSSASSRVEESVPEPTAPDVDVDGDGFERFEAVGDEREEGRGATVTGLPEPPRPVVTSFAFGETGDEEEVEVEEGEEELGEVGLPAYAPSGADRDEGPEPSAPPPEEDEELEYLDEEEEEGLDEQAEGELEEEGEEDGYEQAGRREHGEV